LVALPATGSINVKQTVSTLTEGQAEDTPGCFVKTNFALLVSIIE
jgi:hypothetical protein